LIDEAIECIKPESSNPTKGLEKDQSPFNTSFSPFNVKDESGVETFQVKP
jgi:hypothetical protein